MVPWEITKPNKNVQIPEDKTPAGRTHPIPLWLVAPCDCIELSSILLQHQSPWSNWQVTWLGGTLMPSSLLDTHSSPLTQPKRIQVSDEMRSLMLLERYDIIQYVCDISRWWNNYGWKRIYLYKETVCWVCVCVFSEGESETAAFDCKLYLGTPP